MKMSEFRKREYVRGYPLALNGEFDKAEKLFKQGLKKSIKSKDEFCIFEYYLFLMELYLMWGRKQKADETYNEAIRMRPEDPDVPLFYATKLVHPGKNYTAALDMCNESLRMFDKKPEGHISWAYGVKFLCYINMGRYEQAIKILEVIRKKDYLRGLFDNFYAHYINSEKLDLNNKKLKFIFKKIEQLAKGSKHEKYVLETLKCLKERTKALKN